MEIVNIKVQGQLFRIRDGEVGTSFNGGVYWMSSAKSVNWFNESAKVCKLVHVPKGKMIG